MKSDLTEPERALSVSRMLLLLWSLPTDCPPTQQHQTVRFAPLHRQLGDVCFSAELAADAGRKSGPRVLDDGFDDVFASVCGLAGSCVSGVRCSLLGRRRPGLPPVCLRRRGPKTPTLAG